MSPTFVMAARDDSKKKLTLALAGVAWLVGASSHKPKSHGFDSQSGHMLGCRFGPWSWVHIRGNRSMFLSLPLSLPCPLSKINKHVLGEDKKKVTSSQIRIRLLPAW